MGLTGGLVDAGNLFDCLYGLATDQADDSILDKYSDIRIKAYKEVIDPISSANIRRLWDPSPEAIAADPFFQAVKRAATDKEFEQQMKEASKKDRGIPIIFLFSLSLIPDFPGTKRRHARLYPVLPKASRRPKGRSGRTSRECEPDRSLGTEEPWSWCRNQVFFFSRNHLPRLCHNCISQTRQYFEWAQHE